MRNARLALVASFPKPETRPGSDRLYVSMNGKKTALFFIVFHAAFSIMFAMIAGQPAPYLGNVAFLFIMGANNAIVLPFFTIATLVAFAYQIHSSSRDRKLARSSEASGLPDFRSALSTRALALQSLVFLALAVLWPFRFGYPRDQLYGDWWVVTVWYAQVGWPCVNNLIIAAGQFVLLSVVSSAEVDTTEVPSGEGRVVLEA
jgi:ABC-type dipeptide/oligopeptide/nickel transport system permease subunit